MGGALQLQAQDINQIISRSYTDHLIKTLSSDEMEGRGNFSLGIDRAASFIEQEFKTIGLQKFGGLNSYRQSFHKTELKPAQVAVSINGAAIDPQHFFVMGGNQAEINFDQSNGDGWIKMDPEKDFIAQYRSLMRSNKKQLVLVDEKFKELFQRIRGNASRGSIVDHNPEAKPQATVFVLSNSEVKNFDIKIKYNLKKLPLANIIGVLPGKSKPKEVVVFSGHYDHLGIIKSVDGDSIANGADDDASGTTAVIALAKYYKALNNNERTLVFVAFTAEEIGGYGSKYFSQQMNPDDVVAMFNIEMIGKDSKFGRNTAFITGYERSNFGEILQKNLKGTEFSFHPDPYPEQNLFYRSDNATLAALGVPAHTISTVQIDGDKLYHSVKDEYSSLDVENILSTIKAIAKSAISIIQGTDTPNRIPKLER